MYFYSKIMFVLQIGSIEQKSSCNVDLTSDDGFGSVLLQYTKDKVQTSFMIEKAFMSSLFFTY